MMDVDYLVDGIFRTLEPLDTEKVRRSSIDWYIPMTEYVSGKTHYASAADDLDLFEVLRAAEALPVFYGKRVPLLGHKYIDGELGPTLQDHIKKAHALGATRILFINHCTPWVGVKRAAMKFYALLCSRGLHDAITRDITTDTAHLVLPEGELLVVSPNDLPVASVENDKQKLIATFAKGMVDARALSNELQSLFDTRPTEESFTFRTTKPILEAGIQSEK